MRRQAFKLSNGNRKSKEVIENWGGGGWWKKFAKKPKFGDKKDAKDEEKAKAGKK